MVGTGEPKTTSHCPNRIFEISHRTCGVVSHEPGSLIVLIRGTTRVASLHEFARDSSHKAHGNFLHGSEALRLR